MVEREGARRLDAIIYRGGRRHVYRFVRVLDGLRGAHKRPGSVLLYTAAVYWAALMGEWFG